MALEFGDIDDDVESDVDYVVGIVDNKEVELKFKYEVDYNNDISVGKYVKNKVGVNIDDSVGYDVDVSVSSESGIGNDVWEDCCWWSLKGRWWISLFRSYKWS